jgi:hypothetical protein
MSLCMVVMCSYHSNEKRYEHSLNGLNKNIFRKHYPDYEVPKMIDKESSTKVDLTILIYREVKIIEVQLKF